MPRPVDLPRFSRPGERIKWWRLKRGLSQVQLAKKIGIPQGTLSDFENNPAQKSTKELPRIIAELRLNPHYVLTDKGEPEAEYPQMPPEDGPAWPFSLVDRKLIESLDKIERQYVETALLGALAEVKDVRRGKKKA